MKKILITTSLLCVLALIPFTIQAEEKITIDSLKASYREILACNKEGNYVDKSYELVNDNGGKETLTYKECKPNMDYSGINIDEYITDDTITIDDGEGNKYILNYAIQDNGDVLVSSTNTIDNNTTYDEYKKISDNSLIPLIVYPIVAGAKGISYHDSSAYILDIVSDRLLEQLNEVFNGTASPSSYKVVEDDEEPNASDGVTVIKKSEFNSYAIEFAKSMIGTERTSFGDSDKLDTFTSTTIPDVSDNTKYVITHELLIKSSKDFSALEGIAFANNNTNTQKNSLDPVEETTEEPTNTNDRPVAYNPKTGALLNIVPIIILVVIGILLVINNKNYFKKI